MKKNFLYIKDIPKKDLKKILLDAKKRKKLRLKKNNLDFDIDASLKGNLLVQMFEKSSLRTRLSFYLAIRQLGGSALTLRSDELHLKKGGESIADTAKIISLFSDIFMLRTDNDEKLKDFSKHLSIPLINGLSPKSHPTQVLSDIFTIEELKRTSISKLVICWIGDANNNVINSLIEASVKFSFYLKIGCPYKYKPDEKLINWVKKNKGKVDIYDDPLKAANKSDVIFTNKVISMNDKVNIKKKIREFKKFKVNSEVMNVAKKNAIFLHCLPRGQEVTEDVFSGNSSKVWIQASNRVHVQKSIILYCMNKLR